MNIYNELQYDDLTPDLQLVADHCGMDSVRLLLEHLGGLHFYIPKVTKLNKYVKRKWLDSNNKSIKNFARSLNVSETYLRKVINCENENKKV